MANKTNIPAADPSEDNDKKKGKSNEAANYNAIDLIQGLQFDEKSRTFSVNGDRIPQLDPNDPAFDADLYQKYANALHIRVADALKQIVGTNNPLNMTAPEMQAIGDLFRNVILPAAASVNRTINGKLKDIVQTILDVTAYINEHKEDLERAREEWEIIEEYLPEVLKRPEYKGKTVNDLTDEQLEQVINEAKILAEQAPKLPTVNVSGKISEVDYPLDKINSNIWQLLKEADKTGQITFAVEKRGSKKQADIVYSIDFEALEQTAGVTITKQLTAFDKRVYIAASALFNNGYTKAMTVTQIYNAMGNTGRPSADGIKKINASLTKMQAAHIYLNNESEHQVYSKYDKFVYDASLLPMERISAVFNGQTTDSAIHLFREPPLISFARERKQITTVSRKLLESPLSQTDANLQIEDYLIEQISHIKSPKSKLKNKLLYETIFEKCNIKTANQRARAKETITKLLDHYKKHNFIKDYKKSPEGITIFY